MQNSFTKEYGLKWPIVSAAMTGTAGGDLASAAAKGGGLGFIAAFNFDGLKKEIAKARENLGMSPDESFETKPIGTGYLGWLLDKKPALRLNEGLEYALSQGIRNIWLSFGDDLSKWCRFVKSKEPRAKVFVIVSNVEEGLAAVDFGADVLIVQGTEAGGHGSSKGMPLLSFLPTMIQALPERRPHLVAAGGIATGSQIAAALALGAHGVVMGTRFLPTPESMYGQAQKKAVLAAKGNITARTMVFDVMGDTLEWPADIDGRALVNKTLLESLEGKRSVEELKQDYKKALEGQDMDRAVVWSGTSVALVNSTESASEVVEKCGQEALQCLRNVTAHL